MNRPNPRIVQLLILCGSLAALPGCAAGLPARPAHPVIQPRHDLLLFDGHSGAALTWSELLDAVEEADVVIVGELHDDANGHQTQLALVEDVVQRFSDVALSMEMLDRTEQSVVDDYLADIIDRDKFMELTATTAWRSIAIEYLTGEISRKDFARRIMRIGWPDWEDNYQPIIDATKDGGGRVIAANAPWARYSSLVSAEGYDDLDTMTPAQRGLVEKAVVPESGPYREHFWDFMVDRPEGEEPEAPEDGGGEDDDAMHMNLTDEQVRKSFYAQMMYDATMAESIARALRDGSDKVIHLVGQFHSDFEGGTVMELRRRVPGVRVLTISMQREDVVALRADDEERADVVIYTVLPESP